MPPKKSSQQSSDGASGTSLNLPFISSQIGKLTKLDITSCSPEGFEIWKQRWDSVTTITGFYTLSNETQKALFINVLSDDTIKRMNNLGQCSRCTNSYSIISTSGMWQFKYVCA